MRTPRIYQNQPLIEGNSVELDENGSRHLARVLRLDTAAPVILFNGTGGEYHGQIEQIDNKKVTVFLDFFNEADRTSPDRAKIERSAEDGKRSRLGEHESSTRLRCRRPTGLHQLE